jgi:hypothetical protein
VVLRIELRALCFPLNVYIGLFVFLVIDFSGYKPFIRCVLQKGNLSLWLCISLKKIFSYFSMCRCFQFWWSLACQFLLWVVFAFFFFVMLGIKSRASLMLDKCSATEVQPQLCFWFGRTRVWTQGFTLSKQVLYCFTAVSALPQPPCFWVLSNKFLYKTESQKVLFHIFFVEILHLGLLLVLSEFLGWRRVFEKNS